MHCLETSGEGKLTQRIVSFRGRMQFKPTD
jgi:hypothetical protein